MQRNQGLWRADNSCMNRPRPRLALVLVATLFGWFLTGCAGLPPGYPDKVEAIYGVDDPQFARTMGHLLGPPLDGGHTVTTLNNGDEIFPAMLEAIASARKTITFETFIYYDGDIG